MLALLAVNLLLYHPAIRLGFLSVDDADYVQNNPYIAGFNGDNLRYILTTPYAANYAPANLLSYALDAAVSGGKQPLAFHLSNVLWHGWVACMVYLLAFTIRPGILTAAGAALLFLLHPTHVEVVAWVSSRKDLVATGFAALSMAAYLIYRRRLRLRWWWYAASLAAFLTASAGKQSVLLLPAVMLVWDLLVEKRRAASIAFDKIPFLIVAAFFGWMTWQAQPGTNQARHLFVAAMTQLSDLWLLTGFGQYALYRPAPDPARLERDGPPGNYSCRNRMLGAAAAVPPRPRPRPRGALLLGPDPDGSSDAPELYRADNRSLPVSPLRRRMHSRG